MTRRKVLVASRGLVGLGLLGYILSRLDLETLRIAGGLRLLAGIAVALALLPAAQSLAALRWRTVLGEGAPPWRYLTRLYFIGLFFSLFLPTSVGGDAVRMAAAARNLPRSGEVVASVIVDRLLGVVALGAYLVLGLAVAPSVLSLAGAHLGVDLRGGRLSLAVGGLLVVALAGTLAALRIPAVRGWLIEALGVVRRVLSKPSLALRAFALALLVQALYIAVWGALAAGMGLRLPLEVILVSVPLVSLGAMLPITLSGLGLREGAWLLLLRPYSVAPATVVAFSLLYFVCLVLVGAVGGLLFVVRGTGLPAPVEPSVGPRA